MYNKYDFCTNINEVSVGDTSEISTNIMLRYRTQYVIYNYIHTYVHLPNYKIHVCNKTCKSKK